MRIASILTIAAVLCLSGYTQAETLVDNVGDVTWNASGGAGVLDSNAATNTLTIETAKNSDVTAALPSSIALTNAGDYIEVTLDFVLDHIPANTSSWYEVGFSNSGSGYFYEIDFKPRGGTQNAKFEDTGSTNLGKHDTTADANSVHTISFRITHVDGAGDIQLTADGNHIASGPVTTDATAGGDTTIDTFFFEFNGNGFKEKFDDQNIQATITNFSVTTNVPEPAGMGLMGVGSLLLMRRAR